MPIIAITANALQGEAERCLASGMDDYMAKPLEMARLREVLNRWMPKHGAHGTRHGTAPDPVPDEDAPETPGAPSPLRIEALRSVFGDDEETIGEILDAFIDPARSIAAEIDHAVAQNDAAGVTAAAHKLKSAARSIGADSLADLCQALETNGKVDNLAEILRLYSGFSPELETVINAIGDRRGLPSGMEPDRPTP